MTKDIDDRISSPKTNAEQGDFAKVCERRYSRRTILKGGAGLAFLSISACGTLDSREGNKDESIVKAGVAKSKNALKGNFQFNEIQHGVDQFHHLADDHEADVLLRWGDPIFEGAPEFDPQAQTPESQLQQFGYNNDFVGYVALPKQAGQDERALLCVNHEYPIHGLMFPNFGEDPRASLTEEQVKISQAASGNTIVEIARTGPEWKVVLDSKYNRRINALNTKIGVSGPAINSPRLATSVDPEGQEIIGTINNCAGGITPWGTYLTCEENVNYYFAGKLADGHPEAQNLKRYNFGFELFHWSKFDKRFDLNQEPNEANRFGWVVEIDPMDPDSKPIKRTALGRFKHEGGENIIASDGRLVIYMGDDQRGEYLYKFVSRDKVDQQNRAANRDLLDHGILYVARFDADGGLDWMPLSMENPELAGHFNSLADIVIEPRRAADILGATRMDRPEDVVPNAKTGKVYVMLTNNTRRKDDQVDAANPRARNSFGHIIEITEEAGDHTSESGRWDMLVQCGNPQKPAHDAKWNDNISENGWFASPDNGVVDQQGRLWISTDQGEKVHLSGTNDGLWALETEGDLRGIGTMFFRAPEGAEVCGPIFSDNGESLFVAIQHPGDIGTQPGVARYDTATTLWPDFKKGVPPRPSLLAIRRKGGGRVG